MNFISTNCCALLHGQIPNSWETVETLYKELLRKKREEAVPMGNRQTTVMTMVAPEEPGLPNKLLALGYTEVYQFPAKRCYGNRTLRMFCLQLKDLKNPTKKVAVRTVARRSALILTTNGLPDMRYKANREKLTQTI